MPNLNIDVKNIADKAINDNFVNVREFLKKDLFGKFVGKHMEISCSGAMTTSSFPHRLGFTPKDIILTFSTAGTVTFHHESFDSTNIVFSTTQAGYFRFYIGTHKDQ